MRANKFKRAVQEFHKDCWLIWPYDYCISHRFVSLIAFKLYVVKTWSTGNKWAIETQTFPLSEQVGSYYVCWKYIILLTYFYNNLDNFYNIWAFNFGHCTHLYTFSITFISVSLMPICAHMLCYTLTLIWCINHCPTSGQILQTYRSTIFWNSLCNYVLFILWSQWAW